MPYPPCSLFFKINFFWNAIMSLADQLPGPHPGLLPDASRVAGLGNFSLLPEGFRERAHTLSCWGPSLLHHPVTSLGPDRLCTVPFLYRSSIFLHTSLLYAHFSLLLRFFTHCSISSASLTPTDTPFSRAHTPVTHAHSPTHSYTYPLTHHPRKHTHTRTHTILTCTHTSHSHIYSLIYTLTYSYSPTHHPRTHAPVYLHTHMLTHPHTQILTCLSQPPTLDNYELLIGSDLI